MIDGFGTGASAYTLRATYNGGSAAASSGESLSNSPSIIARVRVGAGPEGLAVSKNGTLVYIVNYRDNSVNIVDTAMLSVVSSIAVESGAAAIALSPDETRAFVTNELSDSLSVIDLQTREVVARIPTGSRPHGLAVSPDGRRLYVCNMGSNSLSVIDTTTLGTVRVVAVGINPFNVVVSADGRWVWVANISEADPALSTLSLVDTGALTEVASIAADARARGLGISTDGARLYYSLELNNQINILDTESKQVTQRVSVGGRPYALAASADGSVLWSIDVETFTATLSDAAGQRLDQIPLGDGAAPHAIVFAPDGRRVYIANSSGNELVVVDTDSTTSALRITTASVSGKKLFVHGTGFGDGAKILLDGEVQKKTVNDDQNPTTILIGNKAGKFIAPGQTVVITVRNSDGSLSNGFNFTRPQ